MTHVTVLRFSEGGVGGLRVHKIEPRRLEQADKVSRDGDASLRDPKECFASSNSEKVAIEQ